MRLPTRTLMNIATAVVAVVGISFLVDRVVAQKQYALTAEVNGEVIETTQRLFEDEVRTFGHARALQRFAIAMEPLSNEIQHGYAHQFGRALYDVEGEAGIGGCDIRFSIGCFHQFMSEAIVDLGTDAIPRLYARCAEITGGRETCEHGLGHGIAAANGYDESALLRSLVLCKKVTEHDGVAGCSGGVFMEYNVRTIGTVESSLGTRTMSGSRIYEPCDVVSEEDYRACIFWMPQWWYFGVLGGNRPEADSRDAYRKMGMWCAKSGDPKSCFEGIGYITPANFSFDPARVREMCDAIETGIMGRTYCRGMAALLLHITPQSRAVAGEACMGLAGESRSVCLTYADHNGDFRFSVPMPEGLR